MTPAVTATLQTGALIAVCGLPIATVFGAPEWILFPTFVAIVGGGFVIFWRAAYEVALSRERRDIKHKVT